MKNKFKTIFILLIAAILSVSCSDKVDYATSIDGSWRTTDGWEIESPSGIYSETFDLFLDFYAGGIVDFKMRDSSCSCDGECDGTCNDDGTVYAYKLGCSGTYNLDKEELSIRTEEYWFDGDVISCDATTLLMESTDVYGNTTTFHYTRQVE